MTTLMLMTMLMLMRMLMRMRILALTPWDHHLFISCLQPPAAIPSPSVHPLSSSTYRALPPGAVAMPLPRRCHLSLVRCGARASSSQRLALVANAVRAGQGCSNNLTGRTPLKHHWPETKDTSAYPCPVPLSRRAASLPGAISPTCCTFVAPFAPRCCSPITTL